MRTAHFLFFASFFALTAMPLLAHHMAVVVSDENAVSNLTSAQLGKIFREETKRWPDGREIVVILHRSSAGESITLEHLNKMSPAQWQAWSKQHQDELKLAESDQEVLRIVQAMPGAIGLVDVRAVNGKVKVLHVDGKLPLEDGYLSH